MLKNLMVGWFWGGRGGRREGGAGDRYLGQGRQTEFRLVHIKKWNSHYDHINFNLKGTRNLFLWAERSVFRLNSFLSGASKCPKTLMSIQSNQIFMYRLSVLCIIRLCTQPEIWSLVCWTLFEMKLHREKKRNHL